VLESPLKRRSAAPDDSAVRAKNGRAQEASLLAVGEVRRLRKWPPMIILKTSPSLAHAPIVNGILQARTPISIVFGAILFFVALERSGACRTGWIFQHIIKGEPGRCITWNHSEPLGSGCATAG
jgi:hypothetical protein